MTKLLVIVPRPDLPDKGLLFGESEAAAPAAWGVSEQGGEVSRGKKCWERE